MSWEPSVRYRAAQRFAALCLICLRSSSGLELLGDLATCIVSAERLDDALEVLQRNGYIERRNHNWEITYPGRCFVIDTLEACRLVGDPDRWHQVLGDLCDGIVEGELAYHVVPKLGYIR